MILSLENFKECMNNSGKVEEEQVQQQVHEAL